MKLNVVIPCYNESEVISVTVKEVLNELENLRFLNKITDYEIMLIDDGSKDNTWEIIENLSNDKIRGLKLSTNVGHQNALWAGYDYSQHNCDMVISIDADLQQDIKTISHMIDKFIEGYDIVYGVRKNRSTDNYFKRISSSYFYNIMNFLGSNILPNHADFRLLSNRACKALMAYPERNIFIRGMVRTIGFNETIVYFDVKKRYAGKSQYSVLKMINLAIDGITSFSIKPLHLITIFGAIVAISALCAIIYVLISHLLNKNVPGWSSILLSIWFLGGVQIFSLGLIGEYIGKTYIEVKQRPRYHIEKEV